MEQRIRAVLEEKFPGIQVDFDRAAGQRITGIVVWDGFTGYNHVERQQMVRQALRDALGAEAQSMGILLTYTPREMNAMRAA